MEYTVPWNAKEGPIELLLAKVKNASDRIGIFEVGFYIKVQSPVFVTGLTQAIDPFSMYFKVNVTR